MSSNTILCKLKSSKFGTNEMSEFCRYIENRLSVENVFLDDICEKYGTPCYAYSMEAMMANLHRLKRATSNIAENLLICFAVKSNSNLSVIKFFTENGCGVDCVSIGEIQRALAVGVNAQKIVFSGVGKTEDELKFAVEQNILQINVESEEELRELSDITRTLGKTVNVALRVNTKTEARTHKYLSTDRQCDKFGISSDRVIQMCSEFADTRVSHLNIVGLSCHVGSQITSLDVYREAFGRVIQLTHQLIELRLNIKTLDLGGGIGIDYKIDNNQSLVDVDDYGKLLENILTNFPTQKLKLIIEPGRFLVANAGCLLTRAIRTKRRDNDKEFLIIDAGMNDLIRPCLYQAYHQIVPVRKNGDGDDSLYDIVGPVCESADVFCLRVRLPRIKRADYLAIMNAGAYGSSMSSRYNSRPLVAEVLINGSKVFVIRERETLEDALKFERIIDAI